MNPEIRPERITDENAISDIIEKAFFGKWYSDGDEAELMDKLRELNALNVSLVAELDGVLVGQIAFSPAFPADGALGWYTLGPLAVLPEYQGKGIGSQLVTVGIRAISEQGANGCILVGDPDYYSRFGFEFSHSNAPEGTPPEYFMIKRITGKIPDGPIVFHEAFKHQD